jgi:hypothetical protein
MKNLYVCEKCGKVFSEYDEAWACERSHETVDRIYSWELPQNTDLQTEFYAEGESIPEYVVLKAVELNNDGYPLSDTMPNGSNVNCYHAVVYKRVDKVKLPNGMTADDYTLAMRLRQIADNPKEDETETEEG